MAAVKGSHIVSIKGNVLMERKELTENLPAHVAVIMDGNGRWAEKNGVSPVSYTHLRAHET